MNALCSAVSEWKQAFLQKPFYYIFIFLQKNEYVICDCVKVEASLSAEAFCDFE